MIRDLNEISDGKIYGVNDMVRAACNDCAGCHACCEGMGESIVLDPYDVWRLSGGLGMNFAELTAGPLQLHMTDGLILPVIAMMGEKERCAFLDEKGRCGIHEYRPGLCRVFPLGRIYEDGKIRYFLQTGACAKSGRTKIKVGRWLDTPEYGKNEAFLLEWHSFRKELGIRLARLQESPAMKEIELYVLAQFFIKLCEARDDFYPQFRERLKQAQTFLADMELD